MTKLREAAMELDNIRGGLLLHGELLEDIYNEITDLSQDANETKREHAMFDWHRVQRKLRLLQAITNHAHNEFQRDFADLDETSKLFHRECVKQPEVVEHTKKA